MTIVYVYIDVPNFLTESNEKNKNFKNCRKEIA